MKSPPPRAPGRPGSGPAGLERSAGGLGARSWQRLPDSNDGTGRRPDQASGQEKFVPVQNLREVPFGSIVKARGVATIVSENGDGSRRARPSSGVEPSRRYRAPNRSPTSSPSCAASCTAARHKAQSAKASSLLAVAAGGGRLWGSGHGKFRSRGRGGAATLRGTTWWWRDRCNGTQFGVTEGIGIDVRDPGHKGLIFLQPGDTYFAEI